MRQSGRLGKLGGVPFVEETEPPGACCRTRLTKTRPSPSWSTRRRRRCRGSAKGDARLFAEKFNIKTIGDLWRNRFFRAVTALVDLAGTAK
jgi:hypothetical protein